VDHVDTARRSASPVRPSPVFLLVVAATGIGAWLCVARPIDDGIAVFAFVLSGWILSLILHEFAHAYTAWRGGDRSVADKGYLTLDPRLYTDFLTSIALPLVVLLIGGIGLPGGAVWINRGALRSPATATLVSLAGPATNLVFGAACLIPLSLGLVDVAGQAVLSRALAFLGFLQIVAFVLNLLPVPGLDGFGALEPHLSVRIRQAVAPLRTWGLLLLIGVLFYVDPARDLFFDTTYGILDAFGVDDRLAADGWRLFRFWE
jgi:Zn-dependent protease